MRIRTSIFVDSRWLRLEEYLHTTASRHKMADAVGVDGVIPFQVVGTCNCAVDHIVDVVRNRGETIQLAEVGCNGCGTVSWIDFSMFEAAITRERVDPGFSGICCNEGPRHHPGGPGDKNLTVFQIDRLVSHGLFPDDCPIFNWLPVNVPPV